MKVYSGKGRTMAIPKKATKTQLNSMKQAALQLGIPIGHLKIIKDLYPDAFTSNNQVIIDKVVSYYSNNKDKILEIEGKSLETLKKEKLTNEIILQKLKIEEAKKQSVNINDLSAYKTDFGIQLSGLLKQKFTKELPPQVTGRKEEDVIKLCVDMVNQVFEILLKDMENWTNFND